MEKVKGVLIDPDELLTLQELCHALQAPEDIIIELVEYQLIEPKGAHQQEWHFDSISFKRAKTAVSFHRDLEVNMPGVALALDLLDQIEELRLQLEQVSK